MVYVFVVAQAFVAVWFAAYLSLVFRAIQPVPVELVARDEIGDTLRSSTKWAFFFWYGSFFSASIVYLITRVV